jgi:hypothetical protein
MAVPTDEGFETAKSLGAEAEASEVFARDVGEGRGGREREGGGGRERDSTGGRGKCPAAALLTEAVDRDRERFRSVVGSLLRHHGIARGVEFDEAAQEVCAELCRTLEHSRGATTGRFVRWTRVVAERAVVRLKRRLCAEKRREPAACTRACTTLSTCADKRSGLLAELERKEADAAVRATFEAKLSRYIGPAPSLAELSRARIRVRPKSSTRPPIRGSDLRNYEAGSWG